MSADQQQKHGGAGGKKRSRPPAAGGKGKGASALSLERFAGGKDAKGKAYMKKKKAINRQIYKKASLRRDYMKTLKKEGLLPRDEAEGESGAREEGRGGQEGRGGDRVEKKGGEERGSGSSTTTLLAKQQRQQRRKQQQLQQLENGRGGKRGEEEEEKKQEGKHAAAGSEKGMEIAEEGNEDSQSEEAHHLQQGKEQLGQGGKGEVHSTTTPTTTISSSSSSSRTKRAPKPDPFKRAKAEATKKHDEQAARTHATQERNRRKQGKLQQRSSDRNLLTKRTRKGQPVMNNAITVMLGKLQRERAAEQR